LILSRPTLRGEYREDYMTNNAKEFEVIFVGAYSGTTQFITPTQEGFNWGSSVNQNGTHLVPFILCNKDLDVIAYGNSREELHMWFPDLYFTTLDGSGESQEIWGAYEICRKEADSYSDEYYANKEKESYFLWTHYEDNSVATSSHNSYEEAETALEEEKLHIEENQLTPILEWEINPNF
jgi:hypothetical protein